MRWLLALIALLAVACGGQFRPLTVSERQVHKLAEYVEQLRARCKDGTSSTASAVRMGYMNGGVVYATAAHAAEPGCTLKMDDQEYVVVARDEEWDVALLWRPFVLGLEPYPPTLTQASVYPGQGIVAVGFPYQRATKKAGFQVSVGYVLAKFEQRYKISTPIYFGSSGGPVFSQEGELVGLAVELIRGPPTEYFAVPASKVFEMSRRFTKNFRVDELACNCGVPVPARFYANALAVAQRAQALRDHLGTPLLVYSGYRTPDYNRKVGGAKHSWHMKAAALDLRSNYHTPAELADAYQLLIDEGVVLDGGLGRYKTHIHIDIGPARRWRK